MPDMKYGIMTLGNYYNEMLQYYAEKKRQKEKNKGKMNKKRTIAIDSNVYYNNNYKKNKLYDMNEENE